MNPFTPPWPLRGRHLQSIFGSVGLRRRLVRSATRDLVAASRSEILDCGAGVRLLCQHALPQADQAKRVVVLIHGWEGSAESTYLLSAANALWHAGYRIVRVNLRDHGESHHLNEELFHSCRLSDAVGAVRHIQQRFPDEHLYLCGFSLGGNFCLRLAAQAANEDLDIAGVVAICPVLDPAHTMAVLDSGPAMYRRHFTRKWCVSLEKKKAAFPHRYNFSRLERFKSLTEMTDYFVTHYTEYSDLHEYLRGYALTDGRLKQIRTPTRILLAEDDPVIPIADINKVEASDYLQVSRSRYGGHCGFIGGYDLHAWTDGFIVESLAACSVEKSAERSAQVRARDTRSLVAG